MNPKYTAKDIQVLTGLQAVRKRPSLYIGPPTPATLSRLIAETLCFSRAMANSGKVTKILVRVRNNRVMVRDNGPGFVDDVVGVQKVPLSDLLTNLYAGTKLTDEDGVSYDDFDLMVDGVRYGAFGLAVVNGLCEYFKVKNANVKGTWTTEYARGEFKDMSLAVAVPGQHEPNTGLAFRYKFDPEIFGDIHIHKNHLTKVIKEIQDDTPAEINLQFD